MAGVGGHECVVGVDFGTLSARAVVVRVHDGEELGSGVHEYPHAVIERTLPSSGAALPPQWALQDPADWVQSLQVAVPAAVAAAGVRPEEVVGIATDFTASTPLPVLADGTPLCQLPELAERPHAYPKLWKHHAAGGQAERINAVARERREPWLARYGGLISSEWEFAKGLQIREEDPEVYERMDRFVEAADWIVWQLCGRETRNTCTAGYKGIFQDGGYPSEDYLRALDEGFANFVSEKIGGPLDPLGARAGDLTAQAAQWTGLPEGIAVAVGNVDAHVTAPAARAIQAGQMLAVMGTSTCHIMNGEELAEVPGMCGVVQGGVTPGVWGYEAGQSGVGDIFAWFADHAVPPRYHDEARAKGIDLHDHLSQLAGEQEVGQHGLVALDWNNGNRSVLVDHELSGLIVGLTLSTRAEDVYRALIEATAFGTRKIIETFEASGLPVRELIVAGGLLKNPVIMQIYADVMRRPLHLIASEQGPALGSAMHAAVAAGAYPDIYAAAEAMGKVRRDVYAPDEARAGAYDALYEHYSTLHDHFGRGGDDVMHALRHIRPREVARG
ncbi:MAG TPA: ribulokinase [Solirubrobacteraceae bacterium]